MKGLDTPILLAFLRGKSPARRLIRSMAGEELATTEWNLFELEILARIADPRGYSNRAATLEKLRRRLTVLPIDLHAVRSASKAVSSSEGVPTRCAAVRLMLGAMEANGATEWYTTKKFAIAHHKGRCRVKLVDFGRA
jgi:predicted nucleic acid-binding protein